MKILVFGCQKITINVLRFLLHTDHEIVGVVTHDEERDSLFSDISVSEFCFSCGVPSINFDKKVENKLIQHLKPDIVFSLYYRKILPKSVIDLPPMGCINIHPSLLPKDRGPNPTLYSVLRGDKYAGITLHYIDEGMDTGDIIAQRQVEIAGRTGFEINRDIMEDGTEFFIEHFDSIINGINTREPQKHEQATCNIKFDNKMRNINWSRYPHNLSSQAKAFAAPYSQAITYYGKDRASVLINSISSHGETRGLQGPGSFVVNNGDLIVQTYSTPVIVFENEWNSNIDTMNKILDKGKGRFLL